MFARTPAFVVLVVAAVLTACGTDLESTEEEPAGDAAGMAACSRFRVLATNAFAEVLSEREVTAGLQEVGSLAADSTTSAIRDNGVKVGEEANAKAMITGEPNASQDALAEACNSAFPL